jgi:hypothetical protein
MVEIIKRRKGIKESIETTIEITWEKIKSIKGP